MTDMPPEVIVNIEPPLPDVVVEISEIPPGTLTPQEVQDMIDQAPFLTQAAVEALIAAAPYLTEAEVAALIAAANYVTPAEMAQAFDDFVAGAPGILDTIPEIAQAIVDAGIDVTNIESSINLLADMKADRSELFPLSEAISELQAYEYLSFITNRPSVGQEVFPRESVTAEAVAGVSGLVPFDFFTAYRNETINSIRTWTGSVAAGATPTLCKVGLYSVEPDGDLVLLASSANDTAMWSAIYTEYVKALNVPVNLVRGSRYAVARIIVTAAALPSWPSRAIPAWMGMTTPRVAGHRTGQADLPATVAAAALLNPASNRYSQLIP